MSSVQSIDSFEISMNAVFDTIDNIVTLYTITIRQQVRRGKTLLLFF